MRIMVTKISKLKWPFLAVFVCLLFNGASQETSECEHGILLPDGTCDCDSCYSGETCSEFASRPPKFPSASETVILTEYHLAGEPIFKAKAIDPDEEFCQDVSGCTCTKVTYSIISQDGDQIFQIDKDTGEVTVAETRYDLFPSYELKIGAANEGGESDTMTLLLRTEGIWDDASVDKYMVEMPNGYNDLDRDILDHLGPEDGEEPLSRHKRFVTLPTNVTFTLVKYGVFMNEANIKVGMRIQFKLDILFPAGSTNMQVELFAPDSTYIIMMLCDVNVTVGSNLNVGGTSTPTMESLNNSKYKDRAIIALGTVTNNAADLNTNTPSTITVTYDAVMVENANTVNNQQYWVSAGAEYNNQNDVWVGQASFTALTADDSATFSALPSVNFSGPTSLAIGSAGVYNLDMVIKKPSVSLKLDMFAPINFTNVMSICDVKVIGVNDAYMCSFNDFSSFTTLYYPDGNTVGNGRASVNLGKPINKFAREYAVSPSTSLEGVISLAAKITMLDDTALIGNSYWIGATVEIGATTVWAGQLQVTAVAKPTSQAVSPTFNLTPPTGSNVSESSPAIIQLDMTIPELSYADYEVEVAAPFSNGAVLQVCSISVELLGENLMCLDKELVPTYISSSTTPGAVPDIGKINLGRVNNVGNWRWYTGTSATTKNIVRLKIILKGTGHALATPGSTHNVFFGVYVGSTKLNIGSASLTIGSTGTPPAITQQNTPLWSMTLGGDGADNVPIGKTVKSLLEITTARNMVYSPFNIEFIMPNNSGEAMLKVCKIQVYSYGKNLPCVNKGVLEDGVNMISSFGDGVADRAVLNLPSLCNFERVNSTVEDKLVLAVNVLVRNHAQFATATQTWISAGVMYSSSNLWVGQIAITGNPSASFAPASQVPYIGIVGNSNLTAIPLGYPARFLVRIKIAPNDTVPLRINLTTLDNALSICSLRFVRAGDGIPCHEVDKATFVVLEQDHSLGLIKKGSLDLKMVGNVGTNALAATTVFDDNTIELELTTRLTINAALAPDSSTHMINVVLTYDNSGSSVTTATVTVTATSDTSQVDAATLAGASDVNGTMSVESITGQATPVADENLGTIVKTESKKIVLTVDTACNKTSHMNVKITTPTNVADVMEILYIGVLDAGTNLPCVKHGQTKRTYAPRNTGGLYTDIATLDLGYVCNVGLVCNASSTVNNQFRVEAIVRLLKSATVNNGDTLQIHSSIMSNAQEIKVYSHSLTVGDVAAFKDVYAVNLTAFGGVSLNSTENPITVGISQFKTFPILFKVPPYTSSKVWLDASMPVNTSAVMTLKEVAFVNVGRNIPKLDKYTADYQKIKSSEYNTSQVTRYTMDMGVVTNAGMSYTTQDPQADDDKFALDFTLQMADSAIALHGTTHKISFGLHVAKFIFILEVTVTVSRTGSEAILFNVSCSVDEVNSTLDRIEVDTIFSLDTASTAEGQNSILNLYLPPYVSFVSANVVSPYKSIASVDKIKNAVTLNMGTLFFTDEVHLTTVIASNSSYFVPLGVTGLDSVFICQAIAETHAAIEKTTNLDYVNFTVTTTPESGAGCTPGALGMESNVIKDCQISASADSLTGKEAIKGRYNTGTGWAPFVHYGKVKQERYFQVYFGNKVLVSKIKMQELGPAKAKTLQIRYSNDGISWIENSNNMISPDLGNDNEELAIPNPEAARYIRVMISDLDDNSQTALFRFDFIGCATTSDGPSDPCTGVVTMPTRLSDFSRRSFLFAGGVLYVCDGIQSSMSIAQRCYATTDNLTWRDLDIRVGSMLGYDSEEPRVYAVSADGLHYMSSLDGVVWSTSVPADVTKAKALPTFMAAIKVPVDGTAALNNASPDSAYTSNPYGATAVGVKHFNTVWTTIFSWSSCC